MSLRDFLIKSQLWENNPLNQQIEAIETREDFITFVYSLSADFANNPAFWENSDTGSYLNGMAAWTSVMDNVFRNFGQEVPTEPSWKLFARILVSARSFE